MLRAACRAVRTATAVLLCGCLAGVTSAEVRADQRRLVVRVFNMTRAAPAARAAALDVASGILARAGITAEWRDCSPDADAARCKADWSRGDLTVRVVTEADADGADVRPRPSAVATGDGMQLGFAALDPVTQTGALATVYHNRVHALVERLRLNYPVLLGRAISHEIGHLLLGESGHGSTGLMRAVWTDDELGRNQPFDWLVSPADGERMRRGATSASARTHARR